MKLTENPKKVKTIHLFNYKKIKEKLEIQSNTFFKEIEGYSHEYKINQDQLGEENNDQNDVISDLKKFKKKNQKILKKIQKLSNS